MPWSRSTLTAAARPVAGTTMQRTQSSLLSFNLRDFLDAADEVPMATIAEGEEESALRMVAPYQVSQAAGRQPIARAPQGPPPPGSVWVDCSFYGFWMDEAKVEGYRRTVKSLRRWCRGVGL